MRLLAALGLLTVLLVAGSGCRSHKLQPAKETSELARSGKWIISLTARGGRLIGCMPPSQRRWTVATLQLGQWYDFVLHVRWSSNPHRGYVSLWLNGRQVIGQTTLATLYVGERAYLKQGFYRAPSSLTTTIYHAGMRRGSSRASVSG